jgi:LEA14-like dessication related protein
MKRDVQDLGSFDSLGYYQGTNVPTGTTILECFEDHLQTAERSEVHIRFLWKIKEGFNHDEIQRKDIDQDGIDTS